VRDGGGARPRRLSAVARSARKRQSAPLISQPALGSNSTTGLSSMPPLGTYNVGCGLTMLRSIPDAFTPLVIADFQYRENLTRLRLGNEGVNSRLKLH
jgi:hypothetical protein